MSSPAPEPEFTQSLTDLTTALHGSTLFTTRPSYRTALSLLSVPERSVQFRVCWENDAHELVLNTGYRVQYSSALGPYKGGTRFHPSVNMSVLKMLALEQTCKNALTGLGMGGAKGGADFEPKGKSEGEVRRFCAAYMRCLARFVGEGKDVPAGDVNVGEKEVGWLFGAYKAHTGWWEGGCITGKGRALGGSLMKPQATGFGLVYFIGLMMRYRAQGAKEEGWTGKRVAISGAGNVALWAAMKAIKLGAILVSLSDSKGAIVAVGEAGIGEDDVSDIMGLKKERKQLLELKKSHEKSFKYIEGERPWKHVAAVDVALPSATQNELLEDDAQHLLSAGCKYVAEGSNMGCSQEAIRIFEAHRRSSTKAEAVWFAPGKAANAGGSAVSGLEMAQNSQRAPWTFERVDEQLKAIMESIFEVGLTTAQEYVVEAGTGETLPSILAGSNIAGFIKVAEAMRAEGDWW
ncbi:MAG: hypothetical protein LQ346_003208 [Caloplaca aetnensis]|nr:MAG: hypothetical protein LQ346_003208 [Caloplaca aetnensis]